MFSLFNSPTKSNYEKLVYDFKFNDINGSILSLDKYRNKVILITNVASNCGFTNQYEDLQTLWDQYKKKGLIVIGTPSNDFGKQEPGTNKEIKKFCEVNFGISFPITEKISVKGDNAHPFFLWAKKNHGLSAIPKWNFHKIIIGKDGKIVDTFSSITKPSSKKFISSIEKALK